MKKDFPQKLKIMKNLSKIALVIALNLIFFACNTDEDVNLSEEQLILQEYRPDLLKSIDLSSKRISTTDNGDIYSHRIISNNEKYLFKDYNGDYSIVTILNDKIQYENLTSKNRIVENKTINFTISYNPKEGIKMVDFSNIEIFDISLNGSLSRKMDTCESDFWLDMALCTAGAVGIAASDGPLPFADALAVSYMTACTVRATRTMDRCFGLEPFIWCYLITQ